MSKKKGHTKRKKLATAQAPPRRRAKAPADQTSAPADQTSAAADQAKVSADQTAPVAASTEAQYSPASTPEESGSITISLTPEMVDRLNPEDLQTIAKLVMDFLQGTHSRDVDSPPESFYDPKTGIYHFSGKEYQEGDIIWRPFGRTDLTCSESFENANCDSMPFPARAFDPQDITDSELEELHFKARYQAFSEKSAGNLAICYQGQFWVPSVVFINPNTFECEYLSCVYNAGFCLPSHRGFYTIVNAEIGNLNFPSGVRYVHGHELDWRARFWNEVEVARRDNPDYDPFADPYDAYNNPDTGSDAWEWLFF